MSDEYLNTIMTNMLIILWRSVFLREDTEAFRENH